MNQFNMPSVSQNKIKPVAASTANIMVKGMSAWLAVVRTYQKCSEVLTTRIKPLGLKLAQHDVMMNLLLVQEQTQQQLAEKSFVTKSHMSAVLAEMADLGWITRKDSTQDKRSKAIRLTRQGLALARRAYAAQAEVIGVMMEPLTDKQIAELEKVSRNATISLSMLAEP
jgi:DNA-binding MarR family transcriptional regulator